MTGERVTSNLDLNGTTPTRVQPKVGVWGPDRVPGTRSKRLWRWLIYLVFLLALALVMGLGWFAFIKLH